MEKNRIRPITNGKSSRMSYSRRKEQNTSNCHRQEHAYELFTAEGSFGDAEPDRNPERFLSVVS